LQRIRRPGCTLGSSSCLSLFRTIRNLPSSSHSFHLGISPSLLTRCYGSSFATAETYFASLAYSVYPTGPPPSDPFSTPQYKILSAVCARPPRGQPVEHHIALTRLCLGGKMADQLALPSSSWVDNLRVDVEVWSGWALLAFGHHYARLAGSRGREWEGRRQKWVRRVLELLVVWQLGERRTTFQWREADRHHAKLTEEEGEEPVRCLSVSFCFFPSCTR
jgi:hypothetical protein